MEAAGSLLRALRAERGLSQAAIADSAGISRPYLSQIEAGLRLPSAAVLARLCDGIGLGEAERGRVLAACGDGDSGQAEDTPSVATEAPSAGLQADVVTRQDADGSP